MSHLVTVQTRLHDHVAITAACQRLGLPAPVQGTTKLFSGEATGLIVQLPGWLYPAVVDVLTGLVRYDNYNGRWGEQAQLDRFLQVYTIEKTRQEASKKGYGMTEQALEDGSVRLRIIEGSLP